MTKKKNRNGGYRLHIQLKGFTDPEDEIRFVPLRGMHTPDLSLGPVIHLNRRDFNRVLKCQDDFENTDFDDKIEAAWWALMEEVNKYLPAHYLEVQ